MKKVIENGIIFIKELFKNDFSGHDFHHTLRVFKLASKIAEIENANVDIVKLAALLHDVDDIKLSPNTHKNKDNARKFLKESNIEENTINLIIEIISEISYKGKDTTPSKTLEGKCVQDADRLDAIGAIGIARAFAYGGNHNRVMYDPEIKPNLNMNEEEYRKSNSTTINHFYEKLFNLTSLMNTNAAKEIAKQREKYMEDYIKQFLDEWNGIK